MIDPRDIERRGTNTVNSDLPMLTISPLVVPFQNHLYDPIPPLIVDHPLLPFLYPFHVQFHFHWKAMRVVVQEEVMVSSEYVLRVGIGLLENMSVRAKMHRLGRLLISSLSNEGSPVHDKILSPQNAAVS
jgi:hypothetical protein